MIPSSSAKINYLMYSVYYVVKKVYKIIYKSVDRVHEIVYLIDVLKRYTKSILN